MYKASKKIILTSSSLRDRLKALKHIEQNNSIKIKDIKNADIFAITSNEGKPVFMEVFLEIILLMVVKLSTQIMTTY